MKWVRAQGRGKSRLLRYRLGCNSLLERKSEDHRNFSAGSASEYLNVIMTFNPLFPSLSGIRQPQAGKGLTRYS